VKQSVQVAQLVNGEEVSIRVLSGRAERHAALASALVVFALGLGGAFVLAAGLLLGHRIIHAPGFVAIWLSLSAALALVAAGRARARSRQYVIGASIEDDAFAPLPLALVRGVNGGYVLGLAPGMIGTFEGGRAPLPIEALVREGRTQLPLEAGARAEISMGKTTFVVRAQPPGGEPIGLPAGFWRPFVRRALLPIQVAAIVSFARTVPQGAPLGERDMRSAIPADSSPWDVEKLLRAEAQTQASTLHACFDPLPLGCQHPGYVGVGVSLSKQGEIRSSWIARSTFGRECPVDACMSSVVSGWFFEPLPEAMRIVLPVQVLRTAKPLPVHLGLAPGASSARNGLN
jgi:hypothetical protein